MLFRSSPDSLVWSPPPVLELLDEPGMTVAKVIEASQQDVSEFIKIRTKYFLYR